ncbi:MAG: hypothetical protein COW30_03830 [Rhodospirillales bacterium CG15_BIG_FIL_POST_REV_8_21_14_020_66_15]|nr:MAG: hypothetical protein COW30_03830 [Rhodospirillales bacterium CG15_BIG_FIL_POST_REV_8_21_14_020_66_15]
MKRKKPKARNPVARAVKTLRPQKVKSAKTYRRRAKHDDARPGDDTRDGLLLFAFREPAIRRRADLIRRRAAGRG